tara:strand:- start:376 stop:948 length:573 start_codon:yes stop_codon:yes gene_type:complete
MIGVSLSVLLIAHTFEQVLNTFSFNLAWQEAFPLHLCDLSALSIAYYLISREKIYFNCAYFWGLGGATMALLTPDVEFAFPNPVFFPFFWAHTLILLGVFYAVIAFDERPFFKDVHKVIGISIILMVFIYFFNLIMGSNFWYLMNKPEADSLMNFFPNPPFHMIIVIPIAIAVFYLLYIPFWIKDMVSKD